VTSPFDTWRLDRHTALITGAASGFGEHFAHTLAGAGARVVLAARRFERIEAIAAQLCAGGSQALAVPMDVTSSASIHAAFDQAAAHGFVPDIVVNNAGISEPRPALEVSEDSWDRVVDTNLKGAWLVSREAASRLVVAGQPGCIINVASILAFRVTGQLASYAASKAGLAHLTQALALEWARHRIRVNALAPGYFATDLNRDFLASEVGDKMKMRVPQRRFGEYAQLDGPLLLLASQAGSYMTGSTIVIDGGLACAGA
jgi:NAD(P)-dependent dehydrogenase (short-subunit alcohol dehydrogenase family)